MLFWFGADVSADSCRIRDPNEPDTPVWNRGGTCDYPIVYRDPAGGSNLLECQYQAIDWTESLNSAGWGPAVTNPDNCTGAAAFMKSGGIVIGSTGDCTLNGQDTCWLYWKASDNSGNSDSGFLKSFDIDYTAPVLAQVTAVPSPTNDTIPNYTFSSTESGAITYGGDCSSGTTTATAGNNTITFNVLAQGVHNNCTIRVTDAVGNQSLALNVNSFTIDTTPPTVTNVSSDKPNGSYTTGAVIDVDVTFSEAVTSTGNVTVTLETGTIDRTCTFTVSAATTGTCNYTVQAGDTSSDLTVSIISGTIKDAALNAMTNFVPATNLAANKAIVIDTVAPTVTAFSIDTVIYPAIVTAKDALDIVWTASDNAGGSGIQKHEVWRAPDVSGAPDPDAWACIIGIGCTVNRNAVPGGESDNPAEGTYWYGIHTVDNATNCISEKGEHCGGTNSDSYDVAPLGPRTVRGPIKVVMDKTAPNTTITSQPANPTNSTSASFSFTSTEAGSVFQCKLDAGVFASCTSPKGYVSLTEISHSFEVKATDAAGNTDLTPASYAWVVDITSPGTPGTPDITVESDTGSSSTDSITNNIRPTWVWTASTGSPSSYDVQWATNPAFTQNLGNGSSATNSFTHASALVANTWRFRVKAKDAAGNESEFSGTGTVVIDTTAPGTPNLISPSGTISTTTPTFNWNTVSDPSGVTYTLWVDNDSGFGSLAINQSGLASSSYTPSSGVLSDMTTYYWKVRAVDGAGNTGSFQDTPTMFTVVLNQAPASPTSPLQFKNDGTTSIVNQGFTNESVVKLRASATDADTSEMIRLFFEVALNSGSFASPAAPTIGTSCASGTAWGSCTNKIWYVSSATGNFSSTPFTGTTSVAGLSPATGYKWQVKACDDNNACSSWIGTNPKPNFSVDTTAPTISIAGVANWQKTNADANVSCEDTGGSECNSATYKLKAYDSNPPVACPSTESDYTLANPQTVSSHKWFCAFGKDGAGNSDVSNSPAEFKIDSSEPNSQIQSPASNSWFSNDFSLNTLDEDLDSGLKDLDPGTPGIQCEYKIIPFEDTDGDGIADTEKPSSGWLSRTCNAPPSSPVTFITVGSTDYCKYEAKSACWVYVRSKDVAGNWHIPTQPAGSVKLYNIDWTPPWGQSPPGKLYLTANEGDQIYPIQAQLNRSDTYRVHVTDNLKVSGCSLYIDNIDQGAMTPTVPGCEKDCTFTKDFTFTGTGTYHNNYVTCKDAANNSKSGTSVDVEVKSLSVDLSAIPTSGSINTLFDLVARVFGTMTTGTIDYSLVCDIERSVDISLVKDWNLISLPVTPPNTDIATVVASIANSISNVYWYNTAKAQYDSWSPSSGGVLKTLEPGKGYIFRMKNNAVLAVRGVPYIFSPFQLTQYDPYFIGSPYGGIRLADAIGSCNLGGITLYAIDAQYRYIRIPVNENTRLEEKNGYWITSRQNCTLQTLVPGGVWDYTANSGNSTLTVQDLCQYSSPGTYTAKVAVKRGVGTAEDTVSINVAQNSSPVAAITCEPASCVVYDTEILTLKNISSDPDGVEDIAKSVWDILALGSGPELTCPPGPALCNYTLQPMPTGNHTAQLSVEDSFGEQSSTQKPFTLKRDIIVNFECSLDGSTWQGCNTIQPVQGEIVWMRDISAPSEGASAITGWAWTFQNGNPASVNTKAVSTTFQSSGSKTVTLQVTDNNGRARTGTQTINLAIPFPEWQEISPF